MAIGCFLLGNRIARVALGHLAGHWAGCRARLEGEPLVMLTQ
jgi:hypothetical protein